MMLASLATGIILESYVVTRGLEREEEVRHENESLGNEADDLRESWHDHSRRLEEHMYRGDLAEVEAEEMRALGSLTEELGMQDMNELQAVRQRHASIAALHTQHSIWYKLTVKTADMRGAGTQASVSVRLRGHAHHSELHHLHHSHGERAFGRGATDTFLVASPHDLGELAEIHVEMDGAGKTSAWLLDSISVQRPGADGWWFFPYGQWLGKEDSVHSGALFDVLSALRDHRRPDAPRLEESRVRGRDQDGRAAEPPVRHRLERLHHAARRARRVAARPPRQRRGQLPDRDVRLVRRRGATPRRDPGGRSPVRRRGAGQPDVVLRSRRRRGAQHAEAVGLPVYQLVRRQGRRDGVDAEPIARGRRLERALAPRLGAENLRSGSGCRHNHCEVIASVKVE